MAYVGRTIHFDLHLGADEETFRRAKHLRRNMTKPEKILWDELKSRKLDGLKFRRQHPLKYYIADFYCHEQKLVIEIDGEIHQEESYNDHDEIRSAVLENYGIKVIRFSNEDVINGLEKVKQDISNYIRNNPP